MRSINATPGTTPADMAKLRAWLDQTFASAATLPLSFVFIALWRTAADLLLSGDYYPHTPFHRSPQNWVARQFDQPETGRGLIQGIRLPAAPQESFTLQPQALDPATTYRFENGETGEIRELAGADLQRDGFTLTLPVRAGAIWFYRRLDR